MSRLELLADKVSDDAASPFSKEILELCRAFGRVFKNERQGNTYIFKGENNGTFSGSNVSAHENYIKSPPSTPKTSYIDLTSCRWKDEGGCTA